MDENVPAIAGPIVPALNLGTGNGENTDAYCFGMSFYTAGVSEDLNTDVLNGSLFVQFTVNPDSQGVSGSAVNFQAPAEEGGDVFHSRPAGSNALLADETALGLDDSPENDINSLVVPDEHVGGTTPFFSGLPLTEDTNGDGAVDAPLVYFSINNSVGLGQIGADVLMTPTVWTGSPTVRTAWTALELGLTPGGDEIDALYVEEPSGPGDPGAGPFVYFSLKRGSISLQAGSLIANSFNGSLSGADPGDIIGVVPNGPAGGAGGVGPALGPLVVIPAGTLGLVGDLNPSQDSSDDDLNGLHMSQFKLPVDNWELF
jgi:hypothetical protein